MNVERLATIAEWLEAGAPARNGVAKFDMGEWLYQDPECGTTCCIGGTAREWWGERNNSAFGEASRLLEITFGQANELFTPGEIQLRDITPAWAGRCIRNLIATGKVDWDGTREVQS